MAEDDARLIELARTGDVEAFATFVGRHEHRVHVVLMRLLRDARDVEEATQDVFVQAWRHLDRFRGDAAPSTWLYRIAVNEALMRQRRRQLAETELDEATAAPGSSSAASAAEVAELRSFLLLQISELPFEYRAPLVLRDVTGLSNEEVAAVLGITIAAAKSRVHRARMRVRAALEQWEGGA